MAISALPLACGDDEDDDGDGSSTGGKGGSAGSSTGGRGGSAGSSTGGRGGSGGSTTGGRGGSSGSGGMTGGTAGSVTGGMGGADGGMGGDDGMGGEGGTPEPPMSLCEQVCDSPAGTCAANCVATFCEVFYTNAAGTPACEPLLDAMMTCWAAGDDANWMCAQGVPTYSGTECGDEVDAAYLGGCI